jgi:hypothetical protein
MRSTPTKEHTMKVTVHGPNLNDQTKGTFHVHTARCRDNKVEVARNGSVEPWTIDADNVDDVVEAVYSDQLDETPSNREPDAFEMYVADFHFAPCTSKLPRRAVEQQHPSPETIAAADETIAAELQSVDLDAAVAAATSEPAKPAAKRNEKLQLPKGTTPAKLVLQFVTERATSAPDAGGQARPFITHTNKLVIHAKWLREWLAATLDTDVTVSQAVTMLRDDLKFADRSVAVIGAPTKNLSVWMIDAPRTMSKIERQAAPERKTREPAPAADAKPAAKPRKRASKSTTSKSTSKSSK